jgi:tRNA threonylcarbamoyladenosine biosynthesis protein TsaB
MADPAEPRLLLLETSGRVGLIGLACGPRLLGMRSLDETRRHARDLAPTVRQLLGEHAIKAKELHAVVVSHGPGSYTGLRVGIMSAKALAYATGCKLIAVPTFAVLADAVSDEAEIEVIEDAQQDYVYCQRFRRDAGTGLPQPVRPLQVQALADWANALPKSVPVLGPGLLQYSASLPPRVRLLAESLWRPALPQLLRLGLAMWNRGEFADLWSLEPLYARASSAEENWARKAR